MYGNSKNIDCRKNSGRTPSNSKRSKPMVILLMKKTTDADLYMGLEICYQDIGGAYSKLGIITDTIEQDGILNYLINTSFGAYTADELKLIK